MTEPKELDPKVKLIMDICTLHNLTEDQYVQVIAQLWGRTTLGKKLDRDPLKYGDLNV